MKGPSLEERIREEALFGRLPLLRSEREYSTRGILSTGFTYAVAAWCFLIGGYAANVVGAVQGIVAIVAGCVIGVVLSAAASALACNRYGLEQIDFTKSCFGQRGAKAILVFYVINQIGWTGMILVMFGRGVSNVAGALGFDGGENLTRLAVLCGLAVAYWVIIRGVHVLNVFNKIVTPGLLIVTAFLFYAIFKGSSWHAITALEPIEPASDPRLGYVIAFEYGLGAGFSWWPGIGFLTRNTDTQRNSLYPQVLTMGLGMGVVCCTGLLAGLRFRSFDPTVWMIAVGGPIFGAAALLLVAIANVSASAMMMYTAALSLRHVRILGGLAWKWLALVGFVPVLSYALVPETLYENGSSFLAYNATMFAPISGVLLVDYFLLRRQRLNVSQIFEDHPDGHYRFMKGFNIAALGCMVLGQSLYVWLLDPVSLTARGPVRMLTASGPAVLVPMVLYFMIARLWLVPRGLGGYGASTAPLPLRQPNI
ncbi:MAG: cytosine permease [Deltaproteobacteria bacterium]|nr:cytosine permease [Deltaproteobacteria bacterium]